MSWHGNDKVRNVILGLCNVILSVDGTDLVTELNQNVSGEMKRWKYGADGYPVFE